MSVQEALNIGGVVLLAAAAVLAATACYAYRALDIRGVKDDLAGRRRNDPVAGGIGNRAGYPSTASRSLGAAPFAAKRVTATDTANFASSSSLDVPPPVGGQPDETTELLAPTDGQDAPGIRTSTSPVEFHIISKDVVAVSEQSIGE